MGRYMLRRRNKAVPGRPSNGIRTPQQWVDIRHEEEIKQHPGALEESCLLIGTLRINGDYLEYIMDPSRCQIFSNLNFIGIKRSGLMNSARPNNEEIAVDRTGSGMMASLHRRPGVNDGTMDLLDSKCCSVSLLSVESEKIVTWRSKYRTGVDDIVPESIHDRRLH
ncbi:hypothetical protein T01_7225 [Trichinella spiralis]|uniref:Uncharacterized protein n=1 Tax=Trichinella spiralis TaxID=6334 RepID=A0A0V1BMA7_TRISP|nr:hypothetical protein T01_7225 [Trichinella spiralis]